jgi:hypothetical protein
VAVWTSYTGSPYSFDLFAQRYINVAAVLPAMNAPYVWEPFVVSNNVYQPQLLISWPPLLGISISNYEVYVNGSVTPMAVTTGNQWLMTSTNGLRRAARIRSSWITSRRADSVRPCHRPPAARRGAV